MDGESCICPVRVLDDWAEALKLAAEWDAAARSADAEATDEPPAAGRTHDATDF